MKYFVIIVSMFLLTCIGSKLDQTVEKCENIIKEYQEKSWQECTDFYEDTVLPSLQERFDELENTCNEIITSLDECIELAKNCLVN